MAFNFANATFGVDTTGQFSKTADALTKNPFSSTSAPKSGFSMDPFSAIATIGSAAAGLFGASSSARGTEAAAREAAEATEQAQKTRSRQELAKEFGGFGYDYITQRYNTGAGAFANRWNALKDAQQMATFQAQNPDQINLRAAERFGRVHDYAAQLAASMPGYQPPIGLFG